MNRVEFIKELSNHLAYEVRPSEVHRLIEYYDEMILDLMEDGYSERAAVKKLGDPKQLAYEAAGIPTEVHVPRKFNWLWITLLVLGFPLVHLFFSIHSLWVLLSLVQECSYLALVYCACG